MSLPCKANCLLRPGQPLWQREESDTVKWSVIFVHLLTVGPKRSKQCPHVQGKKDYPLDALIFMFFFFQKKTQTPDTEASCKNHKSEMQSLKGKGTMPKTTGREEKPRLKYTGTDYMMERRWAGKRAGKRQRKFNALNVIFYKIKQEIIHQMVHKMY